MSGATAEWEDARFVELAELRELLADRVRLAPDALTEPVAVEAARAAVALGFPVALKAVGPGIVHKSDVSAVRLHLSSEQEVEAAAADMLARLQMLTAFQVQRMVPPGLEMIVGVKRDTVFGPAVMVGLGGVMAELLRDVTVRLAPVGRNDAREMLSELRGESLLRGFRGSAPVDQEALVDIIVAVGSIALDHMDLLELELNPVVALTDGAVVVDARARRGAPETPRARPRLEKRAAAALLRPSSVVVIGASRDTRKHGGRLLHHLVKHRFPGRVYAVNPAAETVLEQRSYPSVADLPEVPDLACVVLPADGVPEAIRACGERGIPAAIVMSSGFAEAGPAGRRLDEELAKSVAETGIRVCGPNTAGIVNLGAAVCASISMAFDVADPPPGEIGFVTQSGALGSALMSRSWEQGVGFSTWICTGNESDLTVADYVIALAEDPKVRVIAIFLEAVRDPDRFRESCEHARAAGKPVVVFKAGYSAGGRRAVQSHTAAMAGDGVVYDAALRQLGVARSTTLQGLVDTATALAWQPPPKGRRVGVVSASGGACSVIADLAEAAGLAMPRLSDAERTRIDAIVPPYASAENPIDVTMEVTTRPTMVAEVADVLVASPTLDAVVVLLTTNADPPAKVVADGVARVNASSDKPILVVRIGADFLAPQALEIYRQNRIPVFPMPERAIDALRGMWESRVAQTRRE